MIWIKFTISVHFSSLIPKLSMFTLAISCLTSSNLPWFMDLTFQVPIQYCSLQLWLPFPRQTHEGNFEQQRAGNTREVSNRWSVARASVHFRNTWRLVWSEVGCGSSWSSAREQGKRKSNYLWAGIILSLREGTVFVQKNPLTSHLVVKR